MNLDVEFTSIGCNRVVNALDWGNGDIIAFGAHHFVVIYNTAVSWCLVAVAFSSNYL